MAKNLRFMPREHDPEKARPSGYPPMGGHWFFRKRSYANKKPERDDDS
jgi:hypothetical protein